MNKAESLALENRGKGFHCSESVFLAINETLQIADPELVRMVSGLHGGGGARRKRPGVNLTEHLEKVASGRERRPPDQWPIEVTGHLCGALVSGVICIGLLFGRRGPKEDITCVDELAFELHLRFNAALGSKVCRELARTYVPLSDNHTCEIVYRKGVRLAVELILEAQDLVDSCSQFKACLKT